jgi:hypothetical protein
MEALEDRTVMSVTANFNWWMQDRFAMEANGRANIANDAAFVQNIDPTTGKRLGYTVHFNAGTSRSSSSLTDPIVSESWLVRTPDGKEVATMSGLTPSVNLVEGPYFVMLNVRTAGGQFNTVCQTINVRDILIVSVGDSAASGEGDPDIPGYYDSHGTWHPPQWADTPSSGLEQIRGVPDRSGHSAAAKAALAIEQADPHTSVTFVSEAVTGDKTDPSMSGDKIHPGLVGSGGQLDQVKRTVGNRKIDALLVTTGADDLGFSEIIERLVEAGGSVLKLDSYDAIRHDVNTNYVTTNPTLSWHHIGLGQLPALYHELDRAIQQKLDIPEDHVFMTEYFDPTHAPAPSGRLHDSSGWFADGALSDIFPGFQVTAEGESFGYHEVEVPLNNAIHAAAAQYGWHLVDGIAAAFVGHGFTAGNGANWVNTDMESQAIEGPVNSAPPTSLPATAIAYLHAATLFSGDFQQRIDRLNSQGIAHPNETGQQHIATILLHSLEPYLTREANWNAADPAGWFAVTQVGRAVTLTPRWLELSNVPITVTQAPDVPNDFQVWVGSGLAYEAPDQHQQLTVSHGWYDANDVMSVRDLAAGISVTLQAGSGLNALRAPTLDFFTVDGTGSPVTILGASPYASQTFVNIERTAADTTVQAGVGPTQVNISPTAQELRNIAGTVNVLGNGSSTLLKLNDAGLQDRDYSDVYGYPGLEFDRVTYGITDQAVSYTDSSRQVVQVAGGGPVLSQPTYGTTINYHNVASVAINSGAADTTFNVQATAAGTAVTINARTGVRPTAFAGFTGVLGGLTTDQFVVGSLGTVKNVHSRLTLNGSGPADTVLVDDSRALSQDKVTIAGGQPNEVQLGMAPADQLFGVHGGLDVTGMSALTLNLSKAANDVVRLSPSTLTAFAINGDLSEYQAHSGAELDIALGGTTDALLTPGTGGAGTWGFTKGSHKPITFTNVQKTQAQ